MGLTGFRVRVLTAIDMNRPAAGVVAQSRMEKFVVHEQHIARHGLHRIAPGYRLGPYAQGANRLLQGLPVGGGVAPRYDAEASVCRMQGVQVERGPHGEHPVRGHRIGMPA